MKRARELAVAPALVLALGIGTLVAVAGCEGGDDDVLEQADGSLQGELAIYIADDLERGVQTKQYAIRSAPGVERRVEFDSDPGLQPGARLRVWGVPAAGSRMRVTSLKQLAPRTETQTITSQLKAGMKWPAKRLAFDHPRHRRRHEPHRRKRAEGDRGPVDEHRSAAAELLRRGVLRHRGAGRSGLRPVPVLDRRLQHQRHADDVPGDGRRRWAAERSTTTSGTWVRERRRAAGAVSARWGGPTGPPTTPGTTARRAAWS